jgi:UDP-N-acetylmuramate dehydrogenase
MMNKNTLLNNEPLSRHTTIGLGGNAHSFATCTTVEQIKECLTYAKERKLPLQVIGAGSNIIFPDTGYPGLVMKVGVQGVRIDEDSDGATITAQAGEEWDAFVRLCIQRGCAGIECLSGIPGLVGATPIQNVGAYGQEVRETIIALTALDRHTRAEVKFSGSECGFSYRQSRFKAGDADRYIITSMTFHLRKGVRPSIRYAELRNYLESHGTLDTLEPGRPALEAVRSAVLALRKKKSMVLDPSDPNTRSVGSFFMNPVLTREQFAALDKLWKRTGKADAIPIFPAEKGVKVPAAWLVEKAGFHKGLRRGGVGISANHALALVNYGGTTRELLELATEIQEGVYAEFGIRLEREPVVVGS